MKKFFVSFFVMLALSAAPAWAAQAVKPVIPKVATAWKAVTPDGYTPITWAKAPGVASFFKAPSGNGSIDFLTRVNLVQNQIQFIASSTAPLDWGEANPNFVPVTTLPNQVTQAGAYESDTVVTDTVSNIVPTTTLAVSTSTFHNFAFARVAAEAAKEGAQAQFVWNGPFFNITTVNSDLSLALKSTVGTTTLITSGSRPDADMAAERRMLVINNQKANAAIADFDESVFVSTTLSDQGLEGFAPTVYKTDSASGVAARLFLGVSTNGQELVVYCSQGATVQEASDALMAAGVLPEHQLEADGGGSATCGYNLPGQFFVEPARTLPILMGAVTILARGTATTNGMNVRSGPAAKYPVVTKLPKGTLVRVFEEKNGWYRIASGQWVLKTLIKKL